MGGANTKVSFNLYFWQRIGKISDKSKLDYLIGHFQKMQEKKRSAKEGFSNWNTDGDDKYLSFEEFDAGMKSLGITKDRF